MVDFEKYGKQRVDWLDITGGTAVTVLDYFAGKALEGLVSKSPMIVTNADEEIEMVNILARGAYDYAEAMLAERNKRFTPQGTVKGVTGKIYG